MSAAVRCMNICRSPVACSGFGYCRQKNFAKKPEASPEYMRGYLDGVLMAAVSNGGWKTANFPFTWEQLSEAGLPPDLIAKVQAWMAKP